MVSSQTSWAVVRKPVVKQLLRLAKPQVGHSRNSGAASSVEAAGMEGFGDKQGVQKAPGGRERT